MLIVGGIVSETLEDEEDEILKDGNGLFEKVNEKSGVKLTVVKAVALPDGMCVNSPVLDNTVVGEKKLVEETVSVKRGDGEIKLDDETVLVIDGIIVAESLKVIVDVDKVVAVKKFVEETKGDDVIDGVATFVTEIAGEVVPNVLKLLKMDGVTDDEEVRKASAVVDGEIEAELLKEIDDVDKVDTVITGLNVIVVHLDSVAVTKTVEEDILVVVAKFDTEIVDVEVCVMDGVCDGVPEFDGVDDVVDDGDFEGVNELEGVNVPVDVGVTDVVVDGELAGANEVHEDEPPALHDPAGQLVHGVPPVEYVPAVQEVQDVAANPEPLPAKQLSQVPHAHDPYVPAGQGMLQALPTVLQGALQPLKTVHPQPEY